ncbi:MAG: tRNA pseudouridine(55) synthase TruB [Clostridia bacterium]|nr:tRNA pseudouridine(55) synthase TruB [Clostridia bacterium]
MTGVVFLDKPQGMTSFVAANRVKRILGAKKSGHTGTLDPMATGVLVVMLGGATRFIDFLHTHDKAYEATVRLGVTTDTLDIEGAVLTECEAHFTAAEFEAAMLSFLGEIDQVPPMYSAIKKDGKKLYELAREGIEIERESRRVNIYSLEMTGADEAKQEFSFRVKCSAGTYVRSLSSDIGEKLGCGAVLTALRRVEAHGIGIDRCKALEEISEADVVSLETLLEYPSVTVTDAQAQRFSNGGALDRKRIRTALTAGIYKVLSPEGRFLGLGEVEEDSDQLKIKRIYSET